MTNRLFISADISQDIKEKIITIRDNIYGYDSDIRWEKEDKLHFTLKFLGDVEENNKKKIISSLDGLLKNHKPINCSFSQFGIFKKANVPSILWLGINFSRELTVLAENINNKFTDLGFPKEQKRFKPHITLLRLKGREDVSSVNKFLNYNLPELKFTINEISLVKSELLRSGSIYKKIKVFNLI